MKAATLVLALARRGLWCAWRTGKRWNMVFPRQGLKNVVRPQKQPTHCSNQTSGGRGGRSGPVVKKANAAVPTAVEGGSRCGDEPTVRHEIGSAAPKQQEAQALHWETAGPSAVFALWPQSPLGSITMSW
ncbi:MAG: hypothetical protein HEQ39_09200 [Rhizobacter sp.]